MFNDSALMSPDFDEEAYLLYALHTANYEAEQARLAACAKSVRDEMHAILTENVEDVLCQVTAACRAQRDVAVVRQATTSLAHSTSRLRHTVQEPHRIIAAGFAKLQNTNAALTTLREVLKFLSLASRLKGPALLDVSRAARTLRDVEALLQSGGLNGIEAVDERRDAVERAAAAVRARAADMLRRGGDGGGGGEEENDPNNNNSSHGKDRDMDRDGSIAEALQCFFTLGSLPRVLASLMTEQKREVMKVLMRDLDVQAIATAVSNAAAAAPSTTTTTTTIATAASTSSSTAAATAAATAAGGGGGPASVHDVFFHCLQSALAGVTRHTRIVVAVWRALVRRSDPVTHTPFLSAVENPTAVLGDYWQLVAEKLRERLQAAQKRPHLLAAMAGDILRYRALLRGFLADTRGLLELLGGLMERGRRRGDAGLSVEQLRDAWLAQATRDVSERFAAQLLDRHRERLHYVLAKLPNITPARGSGGGSAPTASSSSYSYSSYSFSSSSAAAVVADLQHPRVPAAAQALDVRSYTAVAAQDVSTYRHDPAALSAVLQCVVQCLRGFVQPLADALAKWPLPPLPSVSGDATAAQMLHVCASNACTQLGTDLAALLAALPDEAEAAERPAYMNTNNNNTNISNNSYATVAMSMSAVGAAAVSYDGRDAAAVAERRQQMREIAARLREISEEAVRPFFRSAAILFLDSVLMCADSAAGQAGPGIAQLQSQMRHFLAHFFHLFDPATPSLGERTRGLTDRMMARLIAAISVTYPLTQAAQQHAVACLAQVTRVVLSLSTAHSHGTITRSTMALKGQTHQLAAWYGFSCDAADRPAAEWHALLATLHPVLARLLLLQRVVPAGAGAKRPFTAMGITREAFIEIVENIIVEHLHVPSDAGTEEEKSGHTSLAVDFANDAPSTTSKQLSEVFTAVDACFAEATAGAHGNASLEPIARWTEQLWKALQAPALASQ